MACSRNLILSYPSDLVLGSQRTKALSRVSVVSFMLWFVAMANGFQYLMSFVSSAEVGSFSTSCIQEPSWAPSVMRQWNLISVAPSLLSFFSTLWILTLYYPLGGMVLSSSISSQFIFEGMLQDILAPYRFMFL